MCIFYCHSSCPISVHNYGNFPHLVVLLILTPCLPHPQIFIIIIMYLTTVVQQLNTYALHIRDAYTYVHTYVYAYYFLLTLCVFMV